MHIPFFNIITYFFNIVKPVGPTLRGKGLVSGETSPYDRPLELAKKLHMGEPIGNTGPYSRTRAVSYH